MVKMQITSNAVFIKNRKILFEKRRKDEDNYAGFWALPGGHKRKTESPKQTLIREMKEELGIRIKKMRYIGRFEDIDPTSKRKYSHHYYLCLDYLGEIKKTKEQEKLKWVKFGKIKDLKTTKPNISALKKLKVKL